MPQNNTTEIDEIVIERLNGALDGMNLEAARGVRDVLENSQAKYATPDLEDSAQTSLFLNVVRVPGGFIAVTDRFEKEDFAWSGDRDDLEAIDELVDRYALVKNE